VEIKSETTDEIVFEKKNFFKKKGNNKAASYLFVDSFHFAANLQNKHH
jgi:hypothetical protein